MTIWRISASPVGMPSRGIRSARIAIRCRHSGLLRRIGLIKERRNRSTSLMRRAWKRSSDLVWRWSRKFSAVSQLATQV